MVLTKKNTYVTSLCLVVLISTSKLTSYSLVINKSKNRKKLLSPKIG